MIDVRDRDTWATFPVEAETASHAEGFVLEPAESSRRNPYASRASVYLPHLPRCTAPQEKAYDHPSEELDSLDSQDNEQPYLPDPAEPIEEVEK